MDLATTIIQPIEAEMQQLRALFRDALHSSNPLLQQVVDHTLRRGGKLMRPMLTLLMAKLCGEVNSVAYHAAAALELLHTASLMHDDVVDDSDQRRGQPSTCAAFGNKTAVLAGDFYLATALTEVARTQRTDIVEIVAQLGRLLADGEFMQLASSTRLEAYQTTPYTTSRTSAKGAGKETRRRVGEAQADEAGQPNSAEHEEISFLNEADYYDIIRKKTASLFAACAQTGALAANATDEIVENARLFGEYVGMSFQIKDDIFDYFDDQTIGKPTGNDMREGKLTLPIIHALRTCPDLTALHLAKQVKTGTISSTEIAHLIDFTKAHEGIDYATQVMHDYRDRAVNLLPSLPQNQPILKALAAYADCVVERKK